MYKFAAIAIASFAIIGSSASFAQDVQVGGNLVNTTLVLGANTNTAGFAATARNSVGTIFEGVDVDGDLTNTTLVLGANTNTAAFLATACNDIGAVGAPKAC